MPLIPVQGATQIIQLLGLTPHPEGGHYLETFRAEPLPFEMPGRGKRASSTAIYFLLAAGEFSALHRVQSDEVWHHYAGGTLELVALNDDGELRYSRLGTDFERGERPQLVVPKWVLQAARPIDGDYVLVGCTVAPGFDFADFEMPSRNELVDRFPQHREVIERFTRG